VWCCFFFVCSKIEKFSLRGFLKIKKEFWG